MTCTSCGADNPTGAKFCSNCGAALVRTCASCAAQNAPTARFCSECGAALGDLAREVQQEPRAATAVAERRVVSVLFVDLVGFTTASEARDAEDTRELLTRYFDIARTTIARYGGTVEKFIGDAVMAVWGAPLAKEDDAERAVRAALELAATVPALDPSLRARAGVLTGEAAVTLGAEGQGMVAGDLVNTSSRIQSVAEPGSVLVGDSTKRASEAAIAYQDAGRHELKGKAETVQLWRAVRVVAGAGGALRSTGLEGPFVGRERELRLVKELFHGSGDEKRPQLVLVTGIAGIGKSRLAWEFEKYIDGLVSESFWHRGRCLSYGEGVAYWALAEMVRMRCGIAEDEEPDSARRKLRLALEEYILDADERRGSSRAWRTCSGSKKARQATRRTSSRRGASSSSGWRNSPRQSSSSRTSSGRTRASWTFSSISWTGRGGIRCSCWRSPDRSSRKSGPAGVRASGASARCTSSRSRARRCTIS
jgi:class 3 adenylate cyclase